MNDKILAYINLVIASSGLMISVIGLLQAIFIRHLKKGIRHYFIVFFAILTSYVLCDLVGQITMINKGHIWVTVDTVLLFVESVLSSLLMPFLTGFLLYTAGNKEWKKAKSFRLVVFLWLSYFCILVFTQFSEVIYYYDSENVYHRGPLYPLLLVPPVLLMLTNIVIFLSERKKLNYRERIGFGVYIVIPFLAIIVQMLFYGLYFILFGTVFSSLFMLTILLIDQAEKHYAEEIENERMKTEILMAQIKPHFIYNCLATIRSYLDEPEKAEEVLNHFISFLRGSVDFVNNTECIAASKEFATVENYLYLEKERFGDKLELFEEYEDTDFMIPPFSVQTVVENAVNHGVRSKKDGRGSVKIRSFFDGREHIVEVSDDGPGFDDNEKLENKDKREHVGISNLIERLELMCEGRLEIKSVPGDTKVRIIVPDIKERHKKIGGGRRR